MRRALRIATLTGLLLFGGCATHEIVQYGEYSWVPGMTDIHKGKDATMAEVAKIGELAGYGGPATSFWQSGDSIQAAAFIRSATRGCGRR